MPHSSGGGSHGGGSHGGGSHGGGGGSRGPRVSTRPFRNSRRFRYYDNHGNEHYIYSTAAPRKVSIFELVFNLVMFAPFLLFPSFFLISAFASPKPLQPQYVSSSVHIEDNIGVIDNKISLESTLKEFQNLTGIEPYIITVNDSEWDQYYDDLVNYSYDLYVNHFTDEQHFLIVYSEPDNAGELAFVDWKWEGMQGDDTDHILSESKFERFQKDIQRGLTREDVSVGEAFDTAFSNSLDYIMSVNIDKETTIFVFIFMLIWFTVIGSSVFSIIQQFIRGRRTYEEVPEGKDCIHLRRPVDTTQNYGVDDLNLDMDDSKYNMDDLNYGSGGYILNGEYHDTSKKN